MVVRFCWEMPDIRCCPRWHRVQSRRWRMPGCWLMRWRSAVSIRLPMAIRPPIYMADASPRFRCPHATCYRTYNSEKNLRRHTRAFHSDSLKYQCEYCGKQLASSQNLREHTYLHTGETPYLCGFPGCRASFRQGSQLSAHRKSHRATVCT